MILNRAQHNKKNPTNCPLSVLIIEMSQGRIIWLGSDFSVNSSFRCPGFGEQRNSRIHCTINIPEMFMLFNWRTARRFVAEGTECPFFFVLLLGCFWMSEVLLVWGLFNLNTVENSTDTMFIFEWGLKKRNYSWLMALTLLRNKLKQIDWKESCHGHNPSILSFKLLYIFAIARWLLSTEWYDEIMLFSAFPRQTSYPKKSHQIIAKEDRTLIRSHLSVNEQIKNVSFELLLLQFLFIFAR